MMHAVSFPGEENEGSLLPLQMPRPIPRYGASIEPWYVGLARQFTQDLRIVRRDVRSRPFVVGMFVFVFYMAATWLAFRRGYTKWAWRLGAMAAVMPSIIANLITVGPRGTLRQLRTSAHCAFMGYLTILAFAFTVFLESMPFDWPGTSHALGVVVLLIALVAVSMFRHAARAGR